MLKPAILYKDEITNKFREYYYTNDMLYETGSICNWSPEIEKTEYGVYQYAIINKAGALIGFISYKVDFYADIAFNFGLMSFDRGNALVGKEVFNLLEQLTKRHNRVEWRAVGGNPACRGYDRYITRHNGVKHVLRDSVRDKDGIYHDTYIYEIVRRAAND